MAEKKEVLPKGYVIPIHRSLTTELYWMGVPRNVLLFEVFASIFSVVIFAKFWIVPLMICIHFICRYFGNNDPKFMSVFWRSKDYESFYHP